MDVYKLSLFKGDFQKISTDPRDDKFYVFGYADYLRAEKVSSISQMVKYNMSERLENQRYLQYSLFLFDLHPDAWMPLEVSNQENTEHTDNIFLICPLKLNLPFCQNYDDNSGFIELFDKVNKNVLDDFNDNPNLGKDIKWRLYFCPGAYDIVLIGLSKDVHKLNLATQVLRDMKMPCPVKGYDDFLFLSLSPFIVLHPSLNVKSLSNDLCDVTIQYSFKSALPQREALLSAMSGAMNIDAGKISILTGSGNSDCSVFIRGCTLLSLLPLYGIKLDTDNSKLKLKVKKWIDLVRDHVRASNTYLFSPLYPSKCNSLSKDKCKTPKKNEQRHQLSILLEEIDRISRTVWQHIPISSYNTLDLLIDACHCFLNSGYRQNEGIKIACILYNALVIISKRHDELTSYAIANCLRDISLTVNMTLQADSIQLDSIDGDNMEFASPTAKFLYSYEFMMRDSQSRMRDMAIKKNEEAKEEATVLFFLTIGHSPNIESKFYFRTYDNSWPKLVSINLPNTKFYDKKYSLPYLFHEVGHYTAITYEDRTNRNKYFESMVKTYIILFLYNNISYLNGLDKSFEFSDAEDFVDDIWEKTKALNPGKMPLDNFCMSIREKTREIAELLTLTIKGGKLDSLFYSTFRNLYDDPGYLTFLDHTFRESHADIVMAVWGRLSAAEYLKAHYRYMDSNLMTTGQYYFDKKLHPDADTRYLLRIAAVLAVLNDGNDLSDLRDELSEEEDAFFLSVYDVVYTQNNFLSPLKSYLKDVKAFVSESIPKGGQALSECESLSETLLLMMEQWYQNLLDWRRYADGLVSGIEKESRKSE